ncbi:MAG: hypothetical protein Fur0014_01360 [Rubrivivax sp.]
MKHRLATLALASLLAAPALAVDGIQTFTAGAHFFKRVVTNTNVLLGSNEKFEVLPGAETVIFVPPQTVALVNVGFSAETRCTGEPGFQDWCEMSITVGGTEASPMASTYGGDTFAVDATDMGAASPGNWRTHAFTRHACVRNTTDAPLAVTVAVNWKVTNFGGTPPLFWVDDSALVVEMARGCSVSNKPAPDGGRRAPASAQQ